MPKEELTAIGLYSNKIGSYQIAFETAEKFCYRWRAAPSVVRKQVIYQGAFQEDTRKSIDVAVDVARAAGKWIPVVGSKDDYETIITYKCY